MDIIIKELSEDLFLATAKMITELMNYDKKLDKNDDIEILGFNFKKY